MRGPDSGSSATTLVEAAAAIVVISVLALAGLSLVSGSSFRIRDLLEEARDIQALLQCERALDKFAAGIREPLWARADSLRISGSSVSTDFWKGAGNASASFDGSSLMLSAPDWSFSVGPFDSLAFSPVPGSDGRIVGFQATVGASGRTVPMRALLGALPLGGSPR